MAPREGPLPGVDVRQRHDPRSQAEFRRAPPAHGAHGDADPAAAPTGADVARQRERTGLGGRSGFRHRPPRAAHRPRQAGKRPSAARPRHADHRRSVRPHPSPLAVRDRRGLEGRPRCADREVAPHDHRRRRRRAAVARVPRLRTRRSRAAHAHDPGGRPRRSGARRCRPRRFDARPARRFTAHPARDRQTGQGPAGRSHPDPRRHGRRRRHVPRHPQRARRHREGSVTALDGAVVAPPSRGGRARRSPRRGSPHASSAAPSTRRS